MSVEIKTRQLEIITAAGEILSESGISGLTTKKLAAKMGFAESALYRHFKSKENIIIKEVEKEEGRRRKGKGMGIL